MWYVIPSAELTSGLCHGCSLCLIRGHPETESRHGALVLEKWLLLSSDRTGCQQWASGYRAEDSLLKPSSSRGKNHSSFPGRGGGNGAEKCVEMNRHIEIEMPQTSWLPGFVGFNRCSLSFPNGQLKSLPSARACCGSYWSASDGTLRILHQGRMLINSSGSDLNEWEDVSTKRWLKRVGIKI